MNREEIIKEIDSQISDMGIRSIGLIAFGLIQAYAEKESGGNSFNEAMILRDEFIRIQDAFEEEYGILNGGEGNSYRAP